MGVIIPLLTALVSLFFATSLLDQYLERRRPHQLVWTVGLGLFFLASLFQFLWQVGAATEIVFRLWYFTGAMLVAAYLGAGTIYLLSPRRVGNAVAAVLLALTALAAILGLITPLQSDVSVLTGQPIASLNPGTGERFYPGYVGALTAFLNSAGAFALVGGALFSAAVFARRRERFHRVMSNILIALGAIVASLGGTLERFDLPQPHALTLLIGVIIIFLGFLRSREVFEVYRLPFRRRTPLSGSPPIA